MTVFVVMVGGRMMVGGGDTAAWRTLQLPIFAFLVIVVMVGVVTFHSLWYVGCRWDGAAAPRELEN